MRRTRLGSLTLCILLVIAGPAAAGALSPRLKTLTKASVQSRSVAGQAAAVDLPATGAGSLQRRDGGLVVIVRFADDAAAHRAGLEAAGADVLAISPQQDVTAVVSVDDLEDVAALDGVVYVSEAPAPETSTFGGSGLCQGARVSQADTQLKAFIARNHFGVDGAGMKIGVLSDSYKISSNVNTAAADILNGDLPGPGNLCDRLTPVTLTAEGSSGNDEGRAMVQLVHDLAPEAQLSFASSGNSSTAMAANIRALKTWGADVIVDDITFLNEPMFQDGEISVAVNDVTAGADPVLFLSSAGNESLPDSGGNDIGSWATPAFRPAACPAAVAAAAGAGAQCEDFDPGAGTDTTLRFTRTGADNPRLAFSFGDPVNGIADNFDVYLLNDTNAIAGSATLDNIAGNTPNEFLSVPTGTFQVVLVRKSGTGTPPLKFVFFRASSVTTSEYPTSSGGDIVGPSIMGHNGAQSAVSVAAVPAFDDSALEDYSSRGPIQLYYGPVSGSTPAAPLAGAPVTVAKPDLTASDCVADVIFLPFCGTSAAAPHAAAIAALAMQATPGATPGQVLAAMKGTAHPIAGEPTLGQGAGIVDADATLAALGATADPTGLTPSPLPPISGSLATGDTTTLGRVFRDLKHTGCGTVAAASVSNGSTPYRYDKYDFTNLTNEAVCVRVDLTPTLVCGTLGLSSAVYTPGFVPNAVATNNVGRPGFGNSAPFPYGYLAKVPAGAPFSVVVEEVDTGNLASCPYTLSVDTLAPFGTALPSVPGTPKATVVTTAENGSWSGTPSFAYQWQRCDGGCIDIAGATNKSYTPSADDVGKTLRTIVKASVGARQSSMTSPESAAVAAAPPVVAASASPQPAVSASPSPIPSVVPTVVPDRTAPDTTIRKGPKKRTTSRTARFTFTATEPGSTFVCKLDKAKAFTPCGAKKTFKKLKRRKHTLLVAAVDAAGNVDATPAKKTWTVKKPEPRKRKKA